MAKEKSARIVVRPARDKAEFQRVDLRAGLRESPLGDNRGAWGWRTTAQAMRVARWWAKELDLPVDVED